MKHERRIPAWLLRDFPPLAGLACFWLFVIPQITEGLRTIRGGKPSQDKFDSLAGPLLAAEATLAYALGREAYRCLGYNAKLVRLELSDLPADNIARIDLIRSCMDQMQNLSRAAVQCTDILRRRWSAAPAHTAHGWTGALSAANHGVVRVSTRSSCCVALMASSDGREHPSNHEGVLTCARGPPTLRQNRQRPAQ